MQYFEGASVAMKQWSNKSEHDLREGYKISSGLKGTNLETEKNCVTEY